MTYNRRTVTFSVRIAREALRVLKWKANHDGVPLSSVIRRNLEDEAERITLQFDLNLPGESTVDEMAHALLDEIAREQQEQEQDDQQAGDPDG